MSNNVYNVLKIRCEKQKRQFDRLNKKYMKALNTIERMNTIIKSYKSIDKFIAEIRETTED